MDKDLMEVAARALQNSAQWSSFWSNQDANCLAAAVLSAVAPLIREQERELCIADVRFEEELDGPIPTALIEIFREVGPEEACRSIVRATKGGIEMRIRARGQKAE